MEVLLVAGAVLLIAATGLPGILGLAAGTLWKLGRASANPWIQSLARPLGPLALGFGTTAGTELLLDLAQPSDPSDALSVLDDSLVRLKVDVGHFTNINLWVQLVILAGLLALSILLPRWKLVSRYLGVQQVLSGIGAFLIAATTFTMLADAPLKKWQEKNHAGHRHRYYAAVRKETHAGAREALAKALPDSIQKLTGAQRRQFGYVAQALAKIPGMDSGLTRGGRPTGVPLEIVHRGETGWYEALVRAVGHRVGQNAVSDPELRAFMSTAVFPEPPSGAAGRDEEERSLDQVPATLVESQHERALVEQEEARAERRRVVADQAWQAAQTAVSQLIQLPLPSPILDYLGGCIDGAISETIGRAPDLLTVWWRRNGATASAKLSDIRAALVDAKVRLIERLILPTGAGEPSPSSVEAQVIQQVGPARDEIERAERPVTGADPLREKIRDLINERTRVLDPARWR